MTFCGLWEFYIRSQINFAGRNTKDQLLSHSTHSLMSFLRDSTLMSPREGALHPCRTKNLQKSVIVIEISSAVKIMEGKNIADKLIFFTKSRQNQRVGALEVVIFSRWSERYYCS